MAKLSAQERQAQIVELLNNNGTMKIVELANLFQVSRETIRRDLIALNEAGSVKKLFGGALPVNNFTTLPIDSRMTSSYDVKMQVCQKAFEYIPDHAVLFLDTGSTTLCMANLLKEKSGYTIITNSIPCMNALVDSSNQLIIAGGNANAQVMCTFGMQTVSFLQTLKVDIALLGTAGFDRHKGPATNHFEDSQIKKTAIESAQTSIVLTDSHKATYSSLTQYASWRDIDYLITDKEISSEKASELQEQTAVIIV